MPPTARTYRPRPAVRDDAREIARLLTQLGHPTEEADVAVSWSEWAAGSNDAFVVAREDGSLAAFVTLHVTRVLHRRRPLARLTSLVVDEPDRGRGLGRALVRLVEAEAAARGCGILELTSNLRRRDAHAFYEHLGYERTSARFAKELATGPTL